MFSLCCVGFLQLVWFCATVQRHTARLSSAATFPVGVILYLFYLSQCSWDQLQHPCHLNRIISLDNEWMILKWQTFTQCLVVCTTVSSGQTVFRTVASMLLISSLPTPILAALIAPLWEEEKMLSSKDERSLRKWENHNSMCQRKYLTQLLVLKPQPVGN